MCTCCGCGHYQARRSPEGQGTFLVRQKPSSRGICAKPILARLTNKQSSTPNTAKSRRLFSVQECERAREQHPRNLFCDNHQSTHPFALEAPHRTTPLAMLSRALRVPRAALPVRPRAVAPFAAASRFVTTDAASSSLNSKVPEV